MTTNELSGLANELEALAARLSAQDISPFVLSDRSGMLHNPRLSPPPTPSISNTAAFVRLRSFWPTAASHVTGDEVQSWTKLVMDEFSGAVIALAGDPASARALKAAFRIAHSCWALRIMAPIEFSDWTSAYCTSWLLRKHPRSATMYLLHLASCVLEDPKGNVRHLLAGVAEDVVWRQLASCSHNNPVEFDPIELALGITLCASALPNRDFRLACQKLNEATHQSGTWVVRPHGDIPSCSSLYAVLACIGGFGSPIPESGILLGSVVAHAKWLLSSTTRDTSRWLMSDLTHRLPDVEPWFNFLALEFAHRVGSWLSDRIQTDLLRAYAARSSFDKVTKWTDLLLEPDAHDALTKAFVEPARTSVPGERLLRCTAILFGPPGTAKTTVAEALASEVSWPLIEIGVSDFLAQGLDSVFAQSKTIFEHLLSLNRVIVLLDEVEGVFASREDKDSETFQKLLTSSLLPHLKRLRDRASIILLIATNHINRFDAAVQRPGRIDLIIPVGPPSKDSRKRLLEKLGVAAKLLDPVADHVTDKATIGELLVINRFDPAAKNDFVEFTKAWLSAHGGRSLITDFQLQEFRNAAETFKRLT